MPRGVLRLQLPDALDIHAPRAGDAAKRTFTKPEGIDYRVCASSSGCLFAGCYGVGVKYPV